MEITRRGVAMELEDPLHANREPLATVPQRYKSTPAERAALGKAARKRSPRSSHAGWKPAADRPDPVQLLEEQAAQRDRGAGAHTLRAHALVALRFLPWRRTHHGERLVTHAGLGPSGADMRGRPSDELRALQITASGGSSLISTTSTRPSLDRGSGISSAWPRASRSLAVRRVSRPGFGEHRHGVCSRLSAGHGRDGGDEGDRRLVRTSRAETIGTSLGQGSKATQDVSRAMTKASGKDSLRALSKLTRMVDGQPRF